MIRALRLETSLFDLFSGGAYDFYWEDPTWMVTGDATITEEGPEGAARMSRTGSDRPTWVALLPYEAFRGAEEGIDRRALSPWSKPVWGKIRACLSVHRPTGQTWANAENESDLRDLVRKGAPTKGAPLVRARFCDADELHEARVVEAMKSLVAGDSYLINLARTLLLECEAPLSLVRPNASRFTFAWRLRAPSGDRHLERTVVVESPELAFSLSGDTIVSEPMKGTRPRGAYAEQDRAAHEDLRTSLKEERELTMAVDLHRNDLSKVCRPGTVRVGLGPTFHRGAVHGMQHRIFGKVKDTCTLHDVLHALLPMGSVTGAPKKRTMEIVARLEERRRGLYTGIVGMMRENGDGVFPMAIRTACFVGTSGELGVGGGISIGSDPSLETRETYWKTRRFWSDEKLARMAQYQ